MVPISNVGDAGARGIAQQSVDHRDQRFGALGAETLLKP